MKINGFMEKKHGSKDYPFEKFNISSEVVRSFVTNHWHDEIEIIYVEKGEIRVTVDGRAFCGLPGDIFVINNGQLHEVSGEKAPLEYTAFVFDAEMLEFKNDDSCQRKYIAPVISGKIRFENKIENKNTVLLKEIDRINEDKSECYELLTKAYLMQFFARIISDGHISENASESSNKNFLLKEIISYVEENFDRRIALLEIAAKFNMSHKYFCRFFKSKFHKTFVEYLNDVRIEKACTKLAEGMTVTEAAFCCGFENMSYFTLVFKKRTGMTPSAYKKSEVD